MFNLPLSKGVAGFMDSSGVETAEKSSEKENLILAFHNAVQCVVLLENALSQVKKDSKNKYLDKVLSAREATKRAAMGTVKQKTSMFETTSEKLLFSAYLHDIADNPGNIASVISMQNVLLASSTKKAISEILASFRNIAKDVDFQKAVDTQELMEKITVLRQLVYDQHDRSSYLLMEKIIDSMQKILHSLEKLNEF